MTARLSAADSGVECSASLQIGENLSVEGDLNCEGTIRGILAANSVGADQIQSASVDTDELADNSVTKAKIKNGEVGTDELADNSVTKNKIKDGEVVGAKIALNQIAPEHLKLDLIKNSILTPNSVSLKHLKLQLLIDWQGKRNDIPGDPSYGLFRLGYGQDLGIILYSVIPIAGCHWLAHKLRYSGLGGGSWNVHLEFNDSTNNHELRVIAYSLKLE